MRVPATPRDPIVEEPTDRILLRDGSVGYLRVSTPDDRETMRQFFHELSPVSRYQRFFMAGEASEDLVDRFCDSRDPSRALTLVATRTVGGETRFIGVGTYLRSGDATAEVAFAVEDRLHGQGIATSLLERLRAEAVRRGILTFKATTLPDNDAMLSVFNECGLGVRSASDRDGVELDLTLTPTPASVSASESRARANTAASIDPFLRPRAVAVIGVSRDRGRIGRRVFDALRANGYQGAAYPITPKASNVDGVPAYASVCDAPRPVDLAIVAVPRAAVLAAVDDCAAAGVKALVVLTAGFAETGEEGRRLQRLLTDKVRAYGMRMIGPNCLGVLNAAAAVSLNASFSPVFPAPGRLGLSSQSGALGIVILALANRRRVGLSHFVSVGNRADVSSNDLLQYWELDPATSVIALYLESFGNPRKFARLARRIGRTKPIIAVKAGRTEAGSRAAGSHTAALAATDIAVEALFHQTGVIRAETIDEMFDLAALLAAQPLPAGRRVGIVTNAGGPGILAADACEAAGLTVVELEAPTRASLARVLAPEASVGNPIDMVASAGPAEYRHAIETVLTAENIDALVILYTPVDPTGADGVLSAIQAGIVAARRRGATAKPVAACVMAGDDRPGLQAGEEQIPVYGFPEQIARAMGKIAAYAEWRHAPPGTLWKFDDVDLEAVRAICRGAIAARGSTWLSVEELCRVLDLSGVPAVRTILTTSAVEAMTAAGQVGFPVAAKLVSRSATHKSDLGGVRLDLASAEDVRDAFAALAATAAAHDLPLDGVSIQPMASSGIETMIGVVHDRLFGPLVAFGLGGTDVEALGDVRFRVAPLTDRDVDDLIDHTRAATLLRGHRNRPPGDLAALRDLLCRVSWLADEVPEILEIDLNPVIVGPAGRGCAVVDARIKVGAAS